MNCDLSNGNHLLMFWKLVAADKKITVLRMDVVRKCCRILCFRMKQSVVGKAN